MTVGVLSFLANSPKPYKMTTEFNALKSDRTNGRLIAKICLPQRIGTLY